MRQTIRIFALAIAVASILALLAACGGGSLSKPANGTYKSDEGFMSQTWTFSGSNTITLSAGGGLISTTGTYEVNGSKLTVTTELLGSTTTSGYTITEITSRSFFIDGTKFVKQ